MNGNNVKATCNVCNIYFDSTQCNKPPEHKRVVIARSPAAFTLCNAAKIFKNAKVRSNYTRNRKARPMSAYSDQGKLVTTTWKIADTSFNYETEVSISKPSEEKTVSKRQVQIRLSPPMKTSVNESLRNSQRDADNNKEELFSKKDGGIQTNIDSAEKVIKENAAIQGIVKSETTPSTKTKVVYTKIRELCQEIFHKTSPHSQKTAIKMKEYTNALKPLQVNSSLSILNLSINPSIVMKKESHKPEFPTRLRSNALRVYRRHHRVEKAAKRVVQTELEEPLGKMVKYVINAGKRPGTTATPGARHNLSLHRPNNSFAFGYKQGKETVIKGEREVVQEKARMAKTTPIKIPEVKREIKGKPAYHGTKIIVLQKLNTGTTKF